MPNNTDTQTELDLQIAILRRAVWRNQIAPTAENASYLEHCQAAVQTAYRANQKGN